MKVFLFILFLAAFSGINAQTKDTVNRQVSEKQLKTDSGKKRAAIVHKNADSIIKKPANNIRTMIPVSPSDSSGRNNEVYKSANSPAIHSNFKRQPVSKKESLSFYLPEAFYLKGNHGNISLVSYHNNARTSDTIFYCLAGILFLLGIIKASFPKYFKQIFQFILQPGLRKRNMKEGFNTQSILPSVLFNLIFIVTASLYIVLPANPGFVTDKGRKYWMFCALALLCIYSVKYVVIKISGWIFNAVSAANVYNYVVFSINKVLGVILIPVIVLMAYSNSLFLDNIYSAAGFIIIGLLLYRYIASFILIRGDLKVSVFHFFLYLCAIEILPLLIMYKVLLMKFGKII